MLFQQDGVMNRSEWREEIRKGVIETENEIIVPTYVGQDSQEKKIFKPLLQGACIYTCSALGSVKARPTADTIFFIISYVMTKGDMVILKAVCYAQNFFDKVSFLAHSSHLSDIMESGQ